MLTKTTKNIFKNILKQFYNIKSFSSNDANALMKEPQYPKRIFSGIQPTGAIHLGNYLGAIAQWVKLQNQKEDIILSIADLHSITLPHGPKKLSKNILEIAATLLGCGIDPEKVILFQQSAVPTHTELCWCLGCISTMARATHVPVGEDQVQQIQLTQDLARMFNSRFGNTFPIPHTIITGTEYARLRSLRDPLKKMSKSDPDPKSRICLTDKPDDIVRNIKKARPGVSNLISIHSFVTNKTVDDICREAGNINTGEYKLLVADAVISYIKPIQEKIFYFLSNEQYLLDILKQGGEKAAEISEQNMEEVRYKLGLKFKIKSKQKVKMSVL
ncbi:hypothetical protein NQ314_020903 [Rhamnusium bicolor]|uniref:tryptophan--tRNA ligase n=1 Tax=Rhamnusium bicolor TaxID=1586634 RepID=A0AAV8WJZ4_9CUCU|nr:hypothetical protein NQ314_020903 [Rhamnusium bicolor]